MPKPSTVLEALEFAEEGKYIFDWDDYTPEEFTIQLGLRKKNCIDFANGDNDISNKMDTYKLTRFGKEYLEKYRKKISSEKGLSM